MTKAETLKGYFYLPEVPEQLVAGELSYGPDANIRLQLYGGFKQRADVLPQNTFQPTIQGNLFDGKKVSLINCQGIQSTTSFAGLSTSLYAAEIVFRGMHLQTLEQPVFSTLFAEFDHLYEWLNISGVKVHLSDSNNTIKVDYKKPENIRFFLDDDFEGEFYFSHDIPLDDANTLNPRCYFKIIPKQHSSFDMLSQALWKFQTMFSFLTMHKARIVSLVVNSKLNLQQLSDGYDYERDVEVFYNQLHSTYEEAKWHKFLLPYKNLATSFNAFVLNWYKLHLSGNPILQILYTQLGDVKEFSERDFLSMIQAVEAFHRRYLQDTGSLKENNKVWLSNILNQIDDKEQIRWLKEKLAFSYEPSLKIRLTELFNGSASILFGDSDDEKVILLIRRIVDTRNYYTHYDEKLEAKKADSGQMLAYTQLLRNVLIVVIMKSLDITDDLIQIAISNRMKFRIA